MMTDYSLAPQMYQQGLQSGLQRQFQLATSATPVTQFLQSLRQAKQDELAQQQELDRQRRLDLEEARAAQMEKYQQGQQTLSAIGHFNREGTPENVDAMREAFGSMGIKGAIPADTRVPGRTVEAGAVRGAVEPIVGPDGQQVLPGVSESPAMSFSEFIKKPAGSIYTANEEKMRANIEARRYAQNVKAQIADQIATWRSRKQDWNEDADNPRNKQAVEHAEKYAREAEILQQQIDSGMVDAKMGKVMADTYLANAKAALAAAQTSVVGQYTPAMEGRDQAAWNRAQLGANVKVALDPLNRNVTVKPVAGAPAAPAPQPQGIPLPPERKKQLQDAYNDPLKRDAAKKIADQLWAQGYRW